MLKKMKFKKGDKVIVISGKCNNIKGEILKACPKEDKVIVSGVNLVTIHRKPSNKDQGGRITKESYIHVSNIAHLDPVLNIATKIGFKTLSDGKKIRYAKKSGETIN